MKIDTKMVKKAMGAKLMTQNDLAELAELSRQTVNTVLIKGSCSAQTAAKLAAALDIAPGEFVEGA